MRPFRRCRVGDETFRWLALEFNVTAARELADVERVPVTAAKITDSLYALTVFDEARALEVPLEGTLLFVTLPGNYGRLLVDGTHRAYRCAKEGRDKFPAQVLSEAQAARICTSAKAWQLLVAGARRDAQPAKEA